MFLTNCQHCGRRELAGERSIHSLRNTGEGIEVRYRCRVCNRENLFMTGAHAGTPTLRRAV